MGTCSCRHPAVAGGSSGSTPTAPSHQGLHSPDSATSAMGTPCSCAMKPRMEKMAKPATKLVPLLRKHRATQSLGEGSKASARYDPHPMAAPQGSSAPATVSLPAHLQLDSAPGAAERCPRLDNTAGLPQGKPCPRTA